MWVVRAVRVWRFASANYHGGSPGIFCHGLVTNKKQHGRAEFLLKAHHDI
jgi:hypothetical protein